MPRPLRLLVFALAAPLAAAAAPPPAPGGPSLTGTLAYIRQDGVYVAPAVGGPERRIPQSKDAQAVFLAPGGDTLLYFVSIPIKTKTFNPDSATRGFASTAPFTESQSLPAPLDKIVSPGVLWISNGSLAYVNSRPHFANDHTYTYRPKSGVIGPSPFVVETASGDGRTTAWSTEVRRAGKVVPGDFDTDKALRNAKYPGKVRAYRRALAREPSQGELPATPALAPDGQALYFAQTVGGERNAEGLLFAANLANHHTIVLSAVGPIGGLPGSNRVSPDGKRLVFSCHLARSAVQLQEIARVVDLTTQRNRELLHQGVDRDDLNVTMGDPCWSPDSRNVAADSSYYRLTDADEIQNRRQEGGWQEPGEWGDGPQPRDFEVRLFDAATGRLVRRITHACCPSWSR